MANRVRMAVIHAWVVTMARVQGVCKEEEGQGLVEYGLIIGLVAIVLVAALGLLTGGLQQVFTTITKTLSAA